MLQSDGHQGLIGRGVAHFAGPLLIELDGDRATALNYSLIMRREEDRHFLWRVSAVRWDLERSGSRGGSGGARTACSTRPAPAAGCSATTLQELFGEDRA